MSANIVVVGSINADLFVRMPMLPGRGETVSSGEPQWFPGGKGANQAVASARMGGVVTMVGAVGDDAPGQMCLDALTNSGVNVAHVVQGSTPTSIALVMVEESGENQIVVADGANGTVDVSSPAIGELLAQSDAVICQFEVSQEVVLATARATKGLFCVNAAPVREISAELAEHIDVLIVNEHEFAAYGNPTHGLVVVTAGSGLAKVYRDGAVVAEAQPPLVEAVDTVGAGDTFVGAFVVSLAEGMDTQAALERACAAGSLSTLAQGAQSGMPIAEAVHLFMHDHN